MHMFLGSEANDSNKKGVDELQRDRTGMQKQVHIPEVKGILSFGLTKTLIPFNLIYVIVNRQLSNSFCTSSHW